MAFEIPAAPKVVQQDTKLNHCWAAALFSWMIATNKKPKSAKKPVKDYHGLVDLYADMEKDGVSEEGLKQVVAPDLGMAPPSHSTNNIGEWALEATLKNNGYVLFVYKSYVSTPHTVVVHGSGDSKIKVMDPWWGQLRDIPLSDLNNQTPPMPKMMMWPAGK